MEGEKSLMALVKKSRKTVKNNLRSSPKLTAEEKFWKQVDQQVHYLIADLLNQKLPLPNLKEPQNFDLHQDTDYRTLLADYENNYAEGNLPAGEILAEEIAYEYLLLTSKSILQSLSNFACHQPEYLEELTK